MHAINMAGQQFGRLLVLSRAGVSGGVVTWRCKCACGNEVVASGAAMRKGQKRSCGCLIREEMARRREAGVKHTPEYIAWKEAKARCSNPAHPAYKHYGGRGVEMCAAWRESFHAFLFDVGHRPSRLHSIDRIDNNLGYEPGNCRWATSKVQHNNRRGNVRIEWRGEVRTIAEWADVTGIARTALYQRVGYGWTAERALTTPVRGR